MAVTGGFCPLPARLGGDAETGWTAEQHARIAADHVAKKRTAPLCVFSWTTAASSVTIGHYLGMNGAGLDYAPDLCFSAGDGIHIRWSSGRFLDAYGVAYPILPRHAVTSVQFATYLRPVHTLLNDGIIIKVFDASGSQVLPPPPGSCEIW